MNNILKHSAQLLLASCLILSAGCSDNLIEAPESVETSAQRLVLTASTSSPDTRMSLDQNGITTMWEPGDQLVLYKKSGGAAPIYMNTNIQTASSRATFESDGGVPAGEYWVFYNYNDERVFHTYDLASVDDINSQKRLSMYGEINVTQGVSNTSVVMKHMYAQVTIKLENIPLNYGTTYQVGMYSPSKGFSSHQMFTTSGIVNAVQGGTFTGASGWQQSDKYYHNKRLGDFQVEYDMNNGSVSTANAEAKSALIFPVDLRQEEVFFYVLDYDNSNATSTPRCYEFKKSSTIVNFQAGYRYKVVLDMSSATVTTLAEQNMSTYAISSIDEWRHAAYRGGYSWTLTTDLDFNGQYFFPIEGIGEFDGGDHTLSNITLDRSDEEYVGAFYSAMSLKNLTLENVTIKGKNYVGGFGNEIHSIDKCKIIGTSTIQGTGDYVGGICGVCSYNYGGAGISNVSIGPNCTVKGQNYVGGIVGWNRVSGMPSSSMKVLSNCSSEGTVTALGNYVGGIFGRMGADVYSDYTSLWFDQDALDFSVVKCVNKGNVKGNDYVGGVGGALDVYASCSSNSNPDIAVIKSSLNQGNVEGNERVGGLLGSSMASINTCYSIGSVKGVTYVGGIVGDASLMSFGLSQTGMRTIPSRIINCYSLATVEATAATDPVVGGLVGLGASVFNYYVTPTTMMDVSYSYFAGTCTSNYGIVGKAVGQCNINGCLAVTPLLGDFGTRTITDPNGSMMTVTVTDEVSQDSKFSVTSILDEVNVINGDGAYSSNVWSNYNYYPVKFASFSTETDAPDFTDETI